VPSVSWSTVRGAECLRVGGLEIHAEVRVRPVLVAPPAGLPSTAGTIIEDDGDLCFVPRFAFVGGTIYAVDVDGARVAELIRPQPNFPTTTSVVAIYPSATEVPRNLLRLYVHFSAPMREGRASEHVRLADEAGTEMAGALLALEHELWDPERRRLTVLLDPARIKRGLAPHRELGYPLRTGEAFRVVVDEAFPDAHGAPLRASAERRYEVGEDERRRVQPDRWDVAAPAAGTADPLEVMFDRSLDRALAAGCIRVAGPQGEPLRGTAAIGAAERSWRFEPADAWAPGPHRLVVDALLEDLAGNSVSRVFDRELGRPEDDPGDGGAITLTVQLR
jgi:hypothetical protein